MRFLEFHSIKDANLSPEADDACIDNGVPLPYDKGFRITSHEITLPRNAEIVGVQFHRAEDADLDNDRLYPILTVIGDDDGNEQTVLVHVVTVKNSIPNEYDEKYGTEIREPRKSFSLGKLDTVPLENIGSYADPQHAGRISYVFLQRYASLG